MKLGVVGLPNLGKSEKKMILIIMTNSKKLVPHLG